jgi:hypothetical protein
MKVAIYIRVLDFFNHPDACVLAFPKVLVLQYLAQPTEHAWFGLWYTTWQASLAPTDARFRQASRYQTAIKDLTNTSWKRKQSIINI